MNHATVFSKNKFVVRIVTLIVFINFMIPPQVISASQANLKSFSRNAASSKALAVAVKETTPSRIPESFFSDRKDESRGSTKGPGSRAWNDGEKIVAFDGVAQDYFGYAVAISGDTAVVGMPQDDDNGINSGSAYIYTKTGDQWLYSQKIKEGVTQDFFGRAVAIDGDTIVVGAPLEDENGSKAGAAYIFKKQVNGLWIKVQKITASDGEAEDEFGVSVSISGDNVVVGAHFYSDSYLRCGAAYVFKKNGDTWAQVDKLLAPDRAEADYFGESVSISQDTVIVGAHRDDDNGLESGSAYIFVKNASSGLWPLQQKVVPADGATNDAFGSAVSVYQDTAIIGAHLDDDKGEDSGSAYVYKRNGNSWSFFNKLLALDGAVEDYFGSAVSMSNGSAIVGARYHNDPELDRGAAYIFDEGLNWTETKELLAGDGAKDDYFGWSVGISDNVTIVGAWGDDDLGSKSGSAYIFTNTPAPNTYTITVKTDDTENALVRNLSNNEVGESLVYPVVAGQPFNGTFLAEPPATHVFKDWTNASPSFANPIDISIDPVEQDVTITANFVLKQVTVFGTIKDQNGQAIANAQLLRTVNGVAQPAINVPNINYFFSVSPGDTVAITPVAGGKVFPAGLADNPNWSGVVNANVNKDFIGINYGYVNVSGTVKDQDGQAIPVAKLNVTINGILQIINVPNINYSFAVHAGDQVSVTPAAVNYDFPAGLADNPSWAGMVLANVTKNFVGVANTFTLTYLAGPGGSISGPTPQTVAYGQNGQPVVAVPNPGYHFVKWSDNVMTAARQELNVTADLTVTAYFEIDQFTVSGQVRLNGAGQQGVSIGYSDNQTKDFILLDTTDDNGNYSFTCNYGFTADVYAVDGVHTYSPTHYSYVNLSQSYVNRNYIAVDTFTVSGQVRLNGTGQEDVVIGYSDNQTKNFIPLDTTDENGNYSFTRNYGFTADVYAVDGVHTYSPTHYSYVNLSQSYANKDYVAVDTFTISGQVRLNGAGQQGVSIGYSDNQTKNFIVLDTTDQNGNYSFTRNYGFTADVYAVDGVHTYSPTHYSYTNLNQNYVNRDYDAFDMFNIIVKTDGTEGALVENIQTGEQGTLLSYPVEYNDPFYGEFNALAPEGYELVRWENDMKGDGNLLIIDIDHVTKNVTFTAIFALKKFTLTYLAGPGGTIKGPTPQTVNYGGDGKPVRAVADRSHHFVNWSDGSVENPRQDLNVTEDITVTANFEQNIVLYNLIVNSGSGSGQYEATTVVPIEADPAPQGQEFDQWIGDIAHVKDPMSASTQVTMPANDVEVTATYKPIMYTVIVKTDGTEGALVENIETGEQGTLLSYPVEYNDPFYGEFNAFAPEGYELVRWENDMKGDGNLLIIDIDHVTKDVTFTAIFAKKQFTLTYLVNPLEGGTVSLASEVVTYGENGSLVYATANPGYQFTGWSGDVNTTENPLQIINVTQDMTAVANFAPLATHTITIKTDGLEGALIRDMDSALELPEHIFTVYDGYSFNGNFEALPPESYAFAKWTGYDIVDPENPVLELSLNNVTEDITITANFTLKSYKVYGHAYITSVAGDKKDGSDGSIYMPFIGGEVVTVDPDTWDIIEHTGVMTDEQGYFELYKSAGWSGSIALYRPATGTVLFAHMATGQPLGPTAIPSLSGDYFVYNYTQYEEPEDPSQIWFLGSPFAIYPVVTGRVVDENNNPVQGVEIDNLADPGPVYTNENGEYSIELIMFHYELWADIQPSFPGATFTPQVRHLQPLDRDFMNQDFVMHSADQGKKK